MSGSIRPGSVVEVYVDDPHGKPIDHNHPALVIVANCDEEHCSVVVVSTKVDQGQLDYHVPMPHGPNAKSGLDKPCVAKPEWHTDVLLANCTKKGFVPTKVLVQVRKQLERYMSDNA